MRNLIFYSILFFTAISFLPARIAAQEKTMAKASVNRSKILIGEPIQLTLEVDVPEHEPIRFFDFDSIPHFEFLNKQGIDTSNTGRGTVLSQVIHITSFDSGHWAIPSLSLGENITTDSLPIDVGYSAFNPDQPYHDIKEIIEVTPQEKKKELQWWYIVAGAAVLLLLLIFLLRRKKKPVVQAVAPPIDPYREAMEKLENLGRRRTDRKEYYSTMVDIFRVYVSAKTGIHSLQNTTDDLVAQLKALPIPPDQFTQLAQALRLSDFVKFAKYEPTAEDDDFVFNTIKNSITLVNNKLATPATQPGLPKSA